MSFARRRFLVGLGAFAAIGATHASAQVQFRTQTYDLGDQGALYRVPLDLGNGRRCICTAAVLPRRSFSASIAEHRDKVGALTAVADVARIRNAVVAINGGRFNGAFAPDGLLVVDGKIVGKKRADWIGYVRIDENGNASVTADPQVATARYAVQGNPMLIEPGGKMGIWREDNQRYRRTVLAQSGDLIVAMVTTPVSYFELAYALIEQPGSLFVNRIDAAVNLSGAATTAFYAKCADGSEVDVPSFWPNRDVLYFSRRVNRTETPA